MDISQRLDWTARDLEETRLRSGDKICRREIQVNLLKWAQSIRICKSSEYIMSHFEEPHNHQMGTLNILWVSNSLATHTSPVQNANDMQWDYVWAQRWGLSLTLSPQYFSTSSGDESDTWWQVNYPWPLPSWKVICSHKNSPLFSFRAHNVSARKTIPELTKCLIHCYGIPLELRLKKGFTLQWKMCSHGLMPMGVTNLTTYTNP